MGKTEEIKKEKDVLLEEIKKDNLIRKLQKIKTKEIFIIIFLLFIISISSIYIYYQKKQLRQLKIQITDQYNMLNTINSSVNYREKRKRFVSLIMEKFALKYNLKMSPKTLSKITDVVYEEGEIKYGIKVEVWLILIVTESQFHTTAVSKAGAIGLFQVMPLMGKIYAKYLGIEWEGANKTLKNPIKNAKIGMRMFFDLINEFDGNSQQFITAYNWGEPATRRFIKNGMLDNKRIRKYYDIFLRNKKKIEKILGYKISLNNLLNK